ncbi:MAG: DinB family protein [Candidatus Rokubacteria bacterium]|nr:DinB family protein [Candidatus Rokubacteria bacterium]
MTALTPVEIASLLAAVPAVLRAEVAALPPAVARFHPAPGEWCALEVVGHLLEAERRGFAGRIRQILAAPEPPLEVWDVDAVTRERRDCERAPAALLDELEAIRRESVILVRGLAAADLVRGGQHPKVGRLTVGDLLQEWVHHDRNHVRQLLENVRAYVWPAMGNTQRFSAR